MLRDQKWDFWKFICRQRSQCWPCRNISTLNYSGCYLSWYNNSVLLKQSSFWNSFYKGIWYLKNCFLYFVQNCNLFIPVMSFNNKASGICAKYKNHSFHMKARPIWMVFKLIQTRKDIFKMKTAQNVSFCWKVKPLLSSIANFTYQLLCATEPSVWSNTSLNVAAKAFFFF